MTTVTRRNNKNGYDSTNITAHGLLQSIYRNEEAPLTVRMRAAIESLPYETPKLTAVAHFEGNFADQLDKAIERRSMKLIEHAPVPTEQQLPPDVLKQPMSLPQRNATPRP